MAMVGHKEGEFDDTPVVVNARTFPLPITVLVDPAGGTAKVEVSATHDAVEDPAGARWVDWDPGTVAANAMSSITAKVTAIRFTRVSGASMCIYDLLF